MTNGIFTDITIEDYHKDRDYLSATSLKWARKSLSYFLYMRRVGQQDKPAFSFGNAFELALLDVVAFPEKVAIAPEEMWIAEAMAAKPDLVKPRSSATYQKNEREFELGRAGMYRVADTGKESYETITHMLESCKKDSVIQKLIQNVEYQTSCFWTDDETGLKLKTRPDICKRKNNVIVNVKTIVDGSPAAFSKDLAKWDYPLQACVEISGCLATGLMETVDKYFWLVVEKEPPFNATIYEFSDEDRRYCMDELSYVLNKVKKGFDQNLFPGYSDRADNEWGILTASIPLWYRMQQ